MNVLKWWRIYPLKYKAISALIGILALGFGLLTAFSLLYNVSNLINTEGVSELNGYLYWSTALVVIVGLPFISFAYLDCARKRERAGDIENDARLKDAVSKSKNKR